MSTDPKSFLPEITAQPARCRRGRGEGGNALIYVLVAIGLFAALTFTMARQEGTGELSTLSQDQARIYSTQLHTVSNQVKQAVDMMILSGMLPGSLEFAQRGEPEWEENVSRQVFHPSGGGVVLPAIPAGVVRQVSTDPPAGWYLGRFNNADWTESEDDDVILVAHQINQEVCREINRTITGSPDIPVVSVNPANLFIDDDLHGGTNVEITGDPDTGNCPGCEEYPTLCVEGPGNDRWSFYTIILGR